MLLWGELKYNFLPGNIKKKPRCNCLHFQRIHGRLTHTNMVHSGDMCTLLTWRKVRLYCCCCQEPSLGRYTCNKYERVFLGSMLKSADQRNAHICQQRKRRSQCSLFFCFLFYRGSNFMYRSAKQILKDNDWVCIIRHWKQLASNWPLPWLFVSEKTWNIFAF